MIRGDKFLEILIFGKGQLAIEICGYLKFLGHKIIVVPVIPEPLWAPSLNDYCLQERIPTQSWEKFRSSDSKYQIGVSVYFDKIFKTDDISKFGKLLNIHNGPLPKYRGVNPINWALKNEEMIHGITIHQIEESIDTGEIFGQQIFQINPAVDEVEDVYRSCLEIGFPLFKEVFANIDKIEPIKQNEKDATYYSKNDYERLEDRKGFRRQNSTN